MDLGIIFLLGFMATLLVIVIKSSLDAEKRLKEKAKSTERMADALEKIARVFEEEAKE